MLWPAIDPGLHTFYDRTIAYQADRDSPFSIWGQVAGLEPLRIAILVAIGGAVARPRLPAPAQDPGPGRRPRRGAADRRSSSPLQHWFYLYIVWFYPLLLVATRRPLEREPVAATPATEPEPSPARSSPPAPLR